MRILLISTDKGEAVRLQQQLHQDSQHRFELRLETDVAAARSTLQDASFDLILVDMHRGEDDIATLAAVLNRSVGAHVLVLVPAEKESAGQRALKLGAEHYCLKEQLPADLLLCVCHYSKAPRLHGELPGNQDRQQQERQQRLFEERSAQRRARQDMAKGQEEEHPLRSRDSEHFNQFVRRFGDVMELALERLVYKVDIDISGTLRNLADDLGHLQAQPRDLVQIYSTSLESKRRKATEQRYKGYAEEGRLLLIETMGYLVNHYRQAALVGKTSEETHQAG